LQAGGFLTSNGNKAVAEKPWLAMRVAVAVFAASTTANAIDTPESPGV
jgi:hypothetical protein